MRHLRLFPNITVLADNALRTTMRRGDAALIPASPVRAPLPADVRYPQKGGHGI